MRRTLFNLAAAISLLLFAATVILWIASYQTTIQYSRYDGAWTRSFGSARGRLYFMASAAPAGPRGLGWQNYPPFTLNLRQPLAGEPGVRHHGSLLGVFWYITDGGTPTGVQPSVGNLLFTYFTPNREVFIPDWLTLAVLALLPAIWFILRIVRGQNSDGRHCTCGYNLTGNASGVCPECGMPNPEKSEVVT